MFRFLGVDKISQVWSTDMAIDLGTANTLVYVKTYLNVVIPVVMYIQNAIQ